MHPYTKVVPNLQVPSTNSSPTSLRHAERTYQGVTIAAVLVLLASLWLFW